MESGYTYAVITEQGKRLRNAALYEGAKITFTRFALGNGVYSDEEKTTAVMETLTGLRSEKNTYLINSSTKASPSRMRFQFLVTNFDPDTGESIVTENYTANEIGLFAKEGESSEEILYSIALCIDEAGDAINVYNGYNPLQIIETYTESVGNAENVTIEMASAYALEEDLEAIQRIIEGIGLASEEEVKTMAEKLMEDAPEPSPTPSPEDEIATDEEIEEVIENLDDL